MLTNLHFVLDIYIVRDIRVSIHVIMSEKCAPPAGHFYGGVNMNKEFPLGSQHGPSTSKMRLYHAI